MSDADPGADRDEVTRERLAAVRQQRRGVRAALDGLERAIAAPAAGREAEWTQGVFEHERELQEAFRRHCDATESPGGLFEEIIEHSPRLAHQVAALGAEHVSINDAIEQAMAMHSRSKTAAEVREAAIDVMNDITRHRHNGASLVYEAYTVDIEASD